MPQKKTTAKSRKSAGSTARKADKPRSNRLDGELDAAFSEHTYTAQDGLRLAWSQYGPRASRLTPVLCLSGLSRNARDFHELASWISTIPGRERCVIAPDYRGRGRSQDDRKWSNYNLAVELQDVLDLLTLLNLEKVIVIGTSRGGLLAMLMGAARPGALAAVVLNDIGPVIEPQGLLRIRQHMRERQVPGSWEEAGDNLRRMWETFYPRLGDDQWQTLARKLYREKDGRILPDYDANLVKPMEDMNLDGPPPAMWAQFMSLSHVPVMALRGENSDILSAATLSAMNECHRAMTTLEIADAGHAPLLIDPEEIRPVAAFVNACDQSAEP